MLFKKKKRVEDGIVTIDVNELVEKKRTLAGTALLIVNIIGCIMSVFQMYVAGISTIDVTIFRALHLGFGLCITYMVYPMTKKSSRSQIPWYDYFLAVLATAPNLYIAVMLKELATRAGRLTTMDVVMGVILCITLLEAARRLH